MATGLIPSRQIICGGKCPFFDGTFNFTSKQEITSFVIAFARFLTYLAVPITIIMIIYTGFRMIIGQGKITDLINVFIGLGIVILAYTFTSGFSEILTNGVDINSLLR